MAVIFMKQLLEVSTLRSPNSSLEPKNGSLYLHWKKRNLYHRLAKDGEKVEEAYNFVKGIAGENGTILFVGTKKQAQDSVKEEAERAGQFYINQRWLGGTLTNFSTIQKRIDRLKQLEAWEEDGTFAVLPKKKLSCFAKKKIVWRNSWAVLKIWKACQAPCSSSIHAKSVSLLRKLSQIGYPNCRYRWY